MSEWDLPPERLATTDETGRRVFLYPADVKGKWKNARVIVHSVLIFVFLALPWIKVGGSPLILLDLPGRDFYIFGAHFRAHNAPLLFLILAIGGFGLLFVTAMFGRLWCGWACPQTVFIEAFFRRIERWIEGPALRRKKLENAPWTFEKIWKKSFKWFLFTVSSIVITHSFLAYFVGGDKLIEMVTRDPRESWGPFVFILFTTGLILFDFAWFREQFCTIVCPYGRLQSVLMDKDSMLVAYDPNRGEPRGTIPQRKDGKAYGDCVNCYRCVQVCPTGIDIRRGSQMECIACTACIDACDEVMTKVKKPTGLIRYATESELAGSKTKWIRTRTLLYFALTTLMSLLLIYFLASRQTFEYEILRAKEAPYNVDTDANNLPVVTNHYKIEMANHTDQVRWLKVKLTSIDVEKGLQLITPFNPVEAKPVHLNRMDLFIRFPEKLLTSGTYKTQLEIDRLDENQKIIDSSLVEVDLVGPIK